VGRHLGYGIAVKIAACLNRKAGDLAVESASAGQVHAVGLRRCQIDHGVESQRPDVRVSARGAAIAPALRDKGAGELVANELVLGQYSQALGEV